MRILIYTLKIAHRQLLKRFHYFSELKIKVDSFKIAAFLLSPNRLTSNCRPNLDGIEIDLTLNYTSTIKVLELSIIE